MGGLPREGRRERVGWYFYDFANSAFSTTVVTVFTGPYLTTLARQAADPAGYVHPLGIPVLAGSFFPYVVSLSVLFQVLLLPVLGAIADYSRRKKEMLFFFAYAGAGATAGMYFLHGARYLPGGALFLIANVCFGASVVFYNAYLPDLAPPAQRDALSSVGWALGYLGGGLLLALNLLLLSRAHALGLTTGQAVRICLASAGAWWAVFSLVPLAALRRHGPVRTLPEGEWAITVGFRQLGRTAARAKAHPQLLLFLAAYLLYNDGIQTVISLSSQFGQEELGLPVSTLTGAILLVQFVAFFGSLLFNALAKRAGAKAAVAIGLVLWTAALVYAYAGLRDAAGFYALAAGIAVVLGGTQALSRSLFSRMIPEGQEAEYFSLYEVGERGTSWLGPLLFGLALQFTGSYRVAILSLAAFFLAGLGLLLCVDVQRAEREAQRDTESIPSS
ncbi:MAG: Permease of the major facilitator superfamily-like protein [Deltaproteobacteria bacterium]|nr:Permease of the major facilitator superfamily-like protein [Deltaproteobacteria bacterium]